MIKPAASITPSHLMKKQKITKKKKTLTRSKRIIDQQWMRNKVVIPSAQWPPWLHISAKFLQMQKCCISILGRLCHHLTASYWRLSLESRKRWSNVLGDHLQTPQTPRTVEWLCTRPSSDCGQWPSELTCLWLLFDECLFCTHSFAHCPEHLYCIMYSIFLFVIFGL